MISTTLQFLTATPVVEQAAEISTANTIETVKSLNVLDLAMKGGWIMVVLVILSIIAMYIFFERFMAYRKALKNNPYFLDRINDNIKDDDTKSAINCCQREDTPTSRVIESGIKNINHSVTSLRAMLDNSADLEIANLEKSLPILSTIAAVAPMIGFLGTVTGMVKAFFVMSSAGNNVDISQLAGGIYEAMVTTVGGLIVGIVAIFAHNILVTQINRIQNRIEAAIITFMDMVNEKRNQ